MFGKIKLRSCVLSFIGSAVLAFGLCNIHAHSGISEGGVLGLTLLLDHWFDVSPAFSGFVINMLCYLLGVKTFGREFIIYSIIANVGFSTSYWLSEPFAPLWPALTGNPLLASVTGAVFIGVGAGISVRGGGAPGGDDALAMSLSRLTHLDIQWLYLATDLSVLLLSLTYIPLRSIVYSLLTVVLSGQIIGLVQKLGANKKQASAS